MVVKYLPIIYINIRIDVTENYELVLTVLKLLLVNNTTGGRQNMKVENHSLRAFIGIRSISGNLYGLCIYLFIWCIASIQGVS